MKIRHNYHYGKDWMLKKMINEDSTIVRPIHYLGSKLRMLDTVKNAVDKVEPTGGAICDLFSGSGTVSKYFINYRDVISSDIQVYSSVLCEAEMTGLEDGFDTNKFVDEMFSGNHLEQLNAAFGSLLEYEKKCITEAQSGKIEGLFEIIENGSIYIFENGEEVDRSKELNVQLGTVCTYFDENGLKNSEDIMITRYYGGLYFSYQQAVYLDCIAHFVFSYTGVKKTKMLAALLSTTSEIVNTVGKQFAQPLKVRNSNGEYKKSLLKKILDDRALNVIDIYKKWITHYMRMGKPGHSYDIICDDYVNALHSLKDKAVKVIYADPPYTRYHYSRYYHVLETICLRDNPKITTTFPNGAGGISRAIYREGRHQSPFCIKSKAEGAFEALFKGVSDLGIPLVLSYSPFDPSQAVTPRLQTIDQLIEMAQRYFSEVETLSPGEFTHSKLNSTDKNFDANHEAEILILCRK